MIFYLINTVSGAAVYVGVQEAVNVRVALKWGKICHGLRRGQRQNSGEQF